MNKVYEYALPVKVSFIVILVLSAVFFITSCEQIAPSESKTLTTTLPSSTTPPPTGSPTSAPTASPSVPVLSKIGSWTRPFGGAGNSNRLYLSGNYLFVACGEGGLKIFDKTNPVNLSFVSWCDTPGDAVAVYVLDGYAYVAQNAVLSSGSGLSIINITNIYNPVLVGNYTTATNPGQYHDVQVVGNTAYVANDFNGLRTIDVSDKSNPILLDYYSSTWAYDVCVVGTNAYVADGSNGIDIYNISDPSNITRNGLAYTIGFDTNNRAYGIEVSGNYAYVAKGAAGLEILDISNPSAIAAAGIFNTAGTAYQVQISGSYAFVADGTTGIRILNISNPASITSVGSFNTAGTMYGVVCEGDYAFTGNGTAGIGVIDINPPAAIPFRFSIWQRQAVTSMWQTALPDCR